jgi:hypothetical protein
MCGIEIASSVYIRSGPKASQPFLKMANTETTCPTTPPRFSQVYKSAHAGMRGVCSPWLKKTCRYAEHSLHCPCGMRVGVQKRGNGLARLGMS